MKLVMVEWVDASAFTRWKSLDDLRDQSEPLRCVSVGWLVKKDKRVTIIASHLYDDTGEGYVQKATGDMCIPTGCVQRMTTIKEPKRR